MFKYLYYCFTGLLTFAPLETFVSWGYESNCVEQRVSPSCTLLANGLLVQSFHVPNMSRIRSLLRVWAYISPVLSTLFRQCPQKGG